jgi:hypothetical protein
MLTKTQNIKLTNGNALPQIQNLSYKIGRVPGGLQLDHRSTTNFHQAPYPYPIA